MPGATIDRWGPRQRPKRPSIGTQSWRNLLFLHWIVDPSLLRPLVPEPLELDLCHDLAYVGLVPFEMHNVRSRFWPWELTQAFGETNLRTYVVHKGRPGVYFFSLDASSLLAVLGARLGWSLPYYLASIQHQQHAGRFQYRLQRSRSMATMSLEYQVTGLSGSAGSPPSLANSGRSGTADAGGASLTSNATDESGSAPEPIPVTQDADTELADFLLERYLLFVQRWGSLYEGQVHHRPYPWQTAELIHLSQTILSAHRIDVGTRPPDTIHWSAGVDVEIFPMRRVF